MFVSIYRTSRFAVQNFWRNLWLSLVTVLILVLTLFLVSLVATLNVLADQSIQAVEDKIDINIDFADDATEADIVAAQLYLQNLPEVKQVRYISKDEALEKFKESNADDPNVTTALEELDDNPLPASLVVQAYHLEDYEYVMQQFENSEYDLLAEKKNFADNQAIIDRLTAITLRMYQAGLIVSAVFVLISVVLMFNTIRLAIYAHREELGIMKLVGATNWFIRAPFILEGLLYAILASVLAMGLLWGGMLLAAPYINNFFSGYNFSLQVLFYSHFGYIFAVQFGFSLLLAVGSSMISIGRYLKV